MRPLRCDGGFGILTGSTVEAVPILIEICAVIDGHRRAAGRLQAQVGDINRPGDVGEGVAIHVNILKIKALRWQGGAIKGAGARGVRGKDVKGEE